MLVTKGFPPVATIKDLMNFTTSLDEIYDNAYENDPESYDQDAENDLGSKDVVAPKKGVPQLTSKEALDHMGGYISYTSASKNSTIYKINKDFSLSKVLYIKNANLDIPQRFNFVDKSFVDGLKKMYENDIER